MAIITMMGIDPSLTATGWCIANVCTDRREIVEVVEIGLVETAPAKGKQVRKSSDKLARSRLIVDTINDRITTHGVKIGCSEVPSGAQSANAALAFGIVIGILASLPIPLVEVSPMEVKLAATGTKTADKEDMVRWALDLPNSQSCAWPLGQKNDWGLMLGKRHVGLKAEHPADACGAVQAAIKSEQFRQLAGMMKSLI